MVRGPKFQGFGSWKFGIWNLSPSLIIVFRVQYAGISSWRHSLIGGDIFVGRHGWLRWSPWPTCRSFSGWLAGVWWLDWRRTLALWWRQQQQAAINRPSQCFKQTLIRGFVYPMLLSVLQKRYPDRSQTMDEYIPK